MRTVIIDNDDSFTANLEHLVALCTNSRPEVVSHRTLNPEVRPACDLLVISPGPGTPGDYPVYRRLLSHDVPTLGICLGMQIINEYCGGKTAPLPGCVHGRTDEITMAESVHTVARYHSLYVSRLGEGVELIGANRDGIPMAIRHLNRPLIGFQFHPESFMTPNGRYFIDHAVKFLLQHNR
jgi:para-aminobenzoate synthetase component 2